MAKLSVYIPPFAPDYSGVSSVLFDLNTVTAMHDASGCTGNYTGYDEPRWYGSKSGVFCSGMREIDAVLGDDEKLIQRMLKANEDLKPDIMALVGSPVPMVIGCDLPGVAKELEYRSNVPSFGFDTTGTDYYDIGIALAVEELVKRFGEKGEAIPGAVNILGANPMDFGVSRNLKDLKALILSAGYSINASLSMDYDLNQLKQAPKAQVNIAVSRAGVLTARFMESEYSIPYVAGLPLGSQCQKEFIELIKKVIAEKKSTIIKGEASEESDVLIMGEQIFCNSVRNALNKEFGIAGVTAGCIFEIDSELSCPQDLDLINEKMITKAINDPKYKIVIGDPFFRRVLKEENKLFIDAPHYGISSKLGMDKTVNYIGSLFNNWIDKEKGRII